MKIYVESMKQPVYKHEYAEKGQKLRGLRLGVYLTAQRMDIMMDTQGYFLKCAPVLHFYPQHTLRNPRQEMAATPPRKRWGRQKSAAGYRPAEHSG